MKGLIDLLPLKFLLKRVDKIELLTHHLIYFYKTSIFSKTILTLINCHHLFSFKKQLFIQGRNYFSITIEWSKQPMVEGLIVSIGVFIILGFVTYLGAVFSSKADSPHALIAIYILFITLAQFFAAKAPTIFDFGTYPFIGPLVLFAPAGVIVFPFTLQITDMVNEKWGRKTVYEMIWIALVSQVFMIGLLYLALFLPFGGTGDDPLSYFAIVPSITLASWISFLISERFDAWIYDRLKSLIHDKTAAGREWWKYLWIRNVFSDIISLGLDSIIFVPLAFLILPTVHQMIDPNTFVPIFPLVVILDLIIGQIGTKWVLGIIDTPYMYLTRWIYDKYK